MSTGPCPAREVSASPTGAGGSRRAGWLACVVLALATAAAYHDSFSGPFVFDDKGSIVDNATIRHLGSLREVLSPPHLNGETVGGRPLLNLSLAINYALGGLEVRGYHLVNLALHIVNGLVLLGVARRTLQRTRFAAAATEISFAIALLWSLHPLQTESVTYIAQRAESLASLCLLLTLYGFLRAADVQRAYALGNPPSAASTPANRWLMLSALACLAGMASKETMVAAPLLVLLCDRTFAAGGFRAAWKLRRSYYVALGATWLLLAALVVHSGDRGATAGLRIPGLTSWTYALTQCRAIVHYLRLAFWPSPLVFDYGTEIVRDLGAVAPQALSLCVLLAATAIALRRWPAAGFVAALFFALLAPSSSFVPIATQPMAEHRMYLPLAAVMVSIVLSLHHLLGRRSLFLFIAWAAALGALTAKRNEDYRSAFALWTDTVAKQPNNERAHNNLAALLIERNRLVEAVSEATRAVELAPEFAEARNNQGVAYSALGHPADALTAFQAALRLKPDYPEALNNLGKEWLADKTRLAEAIQCFERALALRPAYAEPLNNLGLALIESGRPAEAVPKIEASLRLDPNSYQAYNNYGIALASSGRPGDALSAFSRAAALNPFSPNIHENWGKALRLLHRDAEAAEHFDRAARLKSPP
jgi:tetratricopeptide (TPR) repeat protein